MSLDRRIVSILYFNGIEDVESVQEFLGEKNGYFEILINNEIKKLKIPDYNYPEENEDVFTSFEYQEEIKNDKIKEIEKDLNDKRAEIASVLKERLIKEDGTPYLSNDWLDENILRNNKKEIFEQKTFEEELLEAKKSSEESNIKVSVEVYNVPSVSIEDMSSNQGVECPKGGEDFIGVQENTDEKIVEKNDEIEDFIGEVKEKPKKPRTKKLKIIESKNDDIDDFINTI